MSEYQYIHFQAIDQPLNDEQLEFMEGQSTRADISRRAFANEYHFGNFHGNTNEMLRRGYDVHLHYANFGIRKLMFRLPAGLPWENKTFDAYRTKFGVQWKPDKKGHGGILEIDPEADAETYEEGVWDFHSLTSELGKIRELLVGGDLRPLYLAWLACLNDDDAIEPPVPAGLGELPPELVAIAEFYEVGEDLISAAAERSPTAAEADDSSALLHAWVNRQPKDALRELLRRMLSEDSSSVCAQTLARIREETGTTAWPTAEPTRTFGQLLELVNQRETRRREREELAQARARSARLNAMAAEPNKTVAQVKKLVKQRSTADYQQAAQQLADLREALGPKHGPKRAQAIAERLIRDNPTLYRLKSALRQQGLIPDR